MQTVNDAMEQESSLGALYIFSYTHGSEIEVVCYSYKLWIAQNLNMTGLFLQNLLLVFRVGDSIRSCDLLML